MKQVVLGVEFDSNPNIDIEIPPGKPTDGIISGTDIISHNTIEAVRDVLMEDPSKASDSTMDDDRQPLDANPLGRNSK